MEIITIKDIANKLKIHPSTVSRALRDDVRVNEKTKKKVKEYAEKFGYVPNIFASSLAKGKTNLVSLIVPDLIHPYYSELFIELEKNLIDNRYILQLFTTDFNDLIFEKVIKNSLSLRVSGIIVAYHKIENLKLPTILIDQEKNNEYNSIMVDNFLGAYEAVDYLINIGHKNIAYITDIYTTKEREKGYRKAHIDNGIEVNESFVLRKSGRSEDIGYNEGLKILSIKKRPGAIFCGNDFIAIGVMKAALQLNIKIPEELSIIGFDDLPIVSFLPVPLTTVRQPIKEIAKYSTNLLVEMIKNPDKKIPTKIIKPQLIIRNSTIKK